MMHLGYRRKRKKAVGSIIGASFLLLILITTFSYHQLFVKKTSDLISAQNDSQDFLMKKSEESLIITNVKRTSLGYLNLSVKNAGLVNTRVIFIGVFDETLTPHNQTWTSVNTFIQISEEVNQVYDEITLQEGEKRTIQLVTEYGNLFYSYYPYPASDDSSSNARFQFEYSETDLYLPPKNGSHSFFSAMQATPDGIHNIISEVGCGVSTNITILTEGFEDSWPPSGWFEDPSNSRWRRDSSIVYEGTYSAQFRGRAFGRSGNLVTLDIDTSSLSSFTIDFWYRDDDTNENQFLVEYWDGTQWDTIADLGSTTQEDQWLNFNDVVSETQYMISDFRIRWVCDSLAFWENVWVDLLTLETSSGAENYRCDLEITWNNLNPDLNNEWLNIYCRNLDTEALIIDVWNGSQWDTIIYGVNSGWNTFNLTEYLLSSTFTLRFNDQTQSNDTTKSSWEIDSLFLSLWD